MKLPDISREQISLLGELHLLDRYEMMLTRGDEIVPVLIHGLKLSLTEDGGAGIRHAAEGLGRLRARDAVPYLLEMLSHDDPVARLKVIWSLGEIGDPVAIDYLIPILGDRTQTGKMIAGAPFYTRERWTIRIGGIERPAYRVRPAEVAGGALERLGEGVLVTSFENALKGEVGSLASIGPVHREGLIVALMKALETGTSAQAIGAARALSALGAIEARKSLLAMTHMTFTLNRVRKVCAECYAELERLSKLPRPAMTSTEHKARTLPRTSSTTSPLPSTLPRRSAS